MNTENMDKLIAQMEAMPNEAFNLIHWLAYGPLSGWAEDIRILPDQAKAILVKQKTSHDCGTVACIAGEAAILAVAEMGESGIFDHQNIMQLATEWMGLTMRQADLLFTPVFDPYDWHVGRGQVTREQAVKVLKDFRVTRRISLAAWKRVGVRVVST